MSCDRQTHPSHPVLVWEEELLGEGRSRKAWRFGEEQKGKDVGRTDRGRLRWKKMGGSERVEGRDSKKRTRSRWRATEAEMENPGGFLPSPHLWA